MAIGGSDQLLMPNKRKSIAILLGVGVLVNYLDRVNLSVAHDALQRTFGISDIVFGYLLGSYSWTYAIMQLPSGGLLPLRQPERGL